MLGGKPGLHGIQGLGPGFFPQNLDRLCIDEVITVTTEEAMVQARRAAREEGLLVGISSGANIAACLKVLPPRLFSIKIFEMMRIITNILVP